LEDLGGLVKLIFKLKDKLRD